MLFLIMLSMVSHMSVSDWGGNLPYPMHNMWDIACIGDEKYKGKIQKGGWRDRERS